LACFNFQALLSHHSRRKGAGGKSEPNPRSVA